jgi:hypothetical protein
MLRLLPLVSPALVAISVLIPSPVHGQGGPDDFVITLERTSCFGPCPIYSVTIDSKGNVTFDGEKYVRVQGRATARVAAARAAALLETAERIGFFSLRERYRTIRNPDGSETMATDLPTQYVTVISGGRMKRIEDYLGAPDGLKALEREIDEVARTKRWIRIDEPTLRQMVRDGWLPSAEERNKLLHEAIGHDEQDVMRALLELGADPNGDFFGANTTPLMYVRSAAAARILLDAGAIPFARSDRGATALLSATYLAPDVTETLLKAGAPADQPDLNGETPLWRASCRGNIGVVKLLLAAGADPGVRPWSASGLECARQSAANARQRRPSPLDGKWPYVEDFDGTVVLLEQALAKRGRR